MSKNQSEFKLNQVSNLQIENSIKIEESPTKESMFLNFKDLKTKM